MAKQKTLSRKDLILVFVLYCISIMLIPVFVNFDVTVLISGFCFGAASMFFFGRSRRPIAQPDETVGVKVPS